MKSKKTLFEVAARLSEIVGEAVSIETARKYCRHLAEEMERAEKSDDHKWIHALIVERDHVMA